MPSVDAKRWHPCLGYAPEGVPGKTLGGESTAETTASENNDSNTTSSESNTKINRARAYYEFGSYSREITTPDGEKLSETAFDEMSWEDSTLADKSAIDAVLKPDTEQVVGSVSRNLSRKSSSTKSASRISFPKDLFEIVLADWLKEYDAQAPELKGQVADGGRMMHANAERDFVERLQVVEGDGDTAERAQQLLYLPLPSDMKLWVEGLSQRTKKPALKKKEQEAKKDEKEGETKNEWKLVNLQTKMLSVFYSIHMKHRHLLDSFFSFGGVNCAARCLCENDNVYAQSQAMEILTKAIEMESFLEVGKRVSGLLFTATQALKGEEKLLKQMENKVIEEEAELTPGLKPPSLLKMRVTRYLEIMERARNLVLFGETDKTVTDDSNAKSMSRITDAKTAMAMSPGQKDDLASFFADKFWPCFRDALVEKDYFFEAIAKVLALDHDPFPNARTHAVKLLGVILQTILQPLMRYHLVPLKAFGNKGGKGSNSENATQQAFRLAWTRSQIRLPDALMCSLLKLKKETNLQAQVLDMIDNLVLWLCGVVAVEAEEGTPLACLTCDDDEDNFKNDQKELKNTEKEGEESNAKKYPKCSDLDFGAYGLLEGETPEGYRVDAPKEVVICDAPEKKRKPKSAFGEWENKKFDDIDSGSDDDEDENEEANKAPTFLGGFQGVGAANNEGLFRLGLIAGATKSAVKSSKANSNKSFAGANSNHYYGFLRGKLEEREGIMLEKGGENDDFAWMDVDREIAELVMVGLEEESTDGKKESAQKPAKQQKKENLSITEFLKNQLAMPEIAVSASAIESAEAEEQSKCKDSNCNLPECNDSESAKKKDSAPTWVNLGPNAAPTAAEVPPKEKSACDESSKCDDSECNVSSKTTEKKGTQPEWLNLGPNSPDVPPSDVLPQVSELHDAGLISYLPDTRMLPVRALDGTDFVHHLGRLKGYGNELFKKKEFEKARVAYTEAVAGHPVLRAYTRGIVSALGWDENAWGYLKCIRNVAMDYFLGVETFSEGDNPSGKEAGTASETKDNVEANNAKKSTQRDWIKVAMREMERIAWVSAESKSAQTDSSFDSARQQRARLVNLRQTQAKKLLPGNLTSKHAPWHLSARNLQRVRDVFSSEVLQTGTNPTTLGKELAILFSNLAATELGIAPAKQPVVNKSLTPEKIKEKMTNYYENSFGCLQLAQSHAAIACCLSPSYVKGFFRFCTASERLMGVAKEYSVFTLEEGEMSISLDPAFQEGMQLPLADRVMLFVGLKQGLECDAANKELLALKAKYIEGNETLGEVVGKVFGEGK